MLPGVACSGEKVFGCEKVPRHDELGCVLYEGLGTADGTAACETVVVWSRGGPEGVQRGSRGGPEG
eukprot:7677238-Pyramimonas_sp.AAC.1